MAALALVDSGAGGLEAFVVLVTEGFDALVDEALDKLELVEELDVFAACQGGVGAAGVEPDPEEPDDEPVVPMPACSCDQASSTLGSIEIMPMAHSWPHSRPRVLGSD
jgi:hypothetical protein